MTQTQEHNAPALRFPKFSGEWVEERFGDIFEINAGGDVDKSKLSEMQTETFKYPIYANSEKNRGLYGFSSSYREEGECITVSGRGSLGTPTARDHKFTPIVRLLVLRPKVKQDIFFFEYGISRTKFFVESTGVPQLTGPQISGYKIKHPPLPEQQRIAAFLSSVDRKIAQLGQKKALLQRYKKGMMQKLFSQELRFKDAAGNNFPDWEEKRLGELSKITTGKLDANAMVPDGLYRFYTCAKQHFQIDKFAFDTDALLVSGNGANVGYVHHYKGKFNAYQRTYVLDGFRENIFYVKFYLDFFLKRRIGVEKKDGNTPYIVMSTLSEMVVALPCMTEQQKIADFLSSIDRKIDFISTELDHAKTFKKGLLQQMFI